MILFKISKDIMEKDFIAPSDLEGEFFREKKGRFPKGFFPTHVAAKPSTKKGLRYRMSEIGFILAANKMLKNDRGRF